ncbi:hypothetical protein F2P56_031195 [Juglans regia]|uniref:Uncharacterized protein n=1 Tax=Juglans regia TaxID=51240 RepID=A0A833WY90_JUGRE|nr:hypothetical protein F2P56_031195 [Juglans regia]
MDGSLPSPPRDTNSSSSTDTSSMSPTYLHWYRQDKLLLSVIFSSVFKNVMPLIAMADTSQEAWDTLAHLFANCSLTRVMQLKETLTLNQRGSHIVSEFLQSIKATADEIALIDTPLTNDVLTLHVLNRLGAEFRDIVPPILARETSLTLEELHDLLLGHEAYLKCLETTFSTLVATANASYRKGNSSPKNNNR